MSYSSTSFSMTRKETFILATLFILTVVPFYGQSVSGVQLSWLGDSAPEMATGVSWGVPFDEGEIPSMENFDLLNDDGDRLPLQPWKLAYWPDGSLKWVGFATIVTPEDGTNFRLQADNKVVDDKTNVKMLAEEDANSVRIDTGVLQCIIPKSGNRIISSLKIADKEVSSGGRLISIRQDGSEKEIGVQPAREKFIGNISEVTLEQNGPVRAVVKIEGKHKSVSGERSWLPFVVRLYFYTNQQSVRMVHTIIYDGDQHNDFVRGLGLAFDIPMDEEVYNRHIRFSGKAGGLWDEPAQPLIGRRTFSSNEENSYASQLKGERIDERETLSENQQFIVDNLAAWNDFKLVQSNSEGFIIKKRTNDRSAWIDAGAGTRSQGMVFAGDVSGGLALTVRNFWQSYPASLEVRDMRKDTAQVKAWLWSPDGPAMDMRHYDTIPYGHTLRASYEDVQPGHSTPMGVARTSEILLFASPDVPSHEMLNNIAGLGNNPPLLTVEPEYIHSIPVLGVWSLEDRSTKGKAWLENQLDKAFDYYQKEVEQRNWYGFWDYGDVMHSYDEDRRSWMYDVGGFAWANTELMPNMWLWYNYLRSGEEDVFRMAEAMTRHTGEVDVYHLGPFKGLGSRHNVRHWGGGAKEVRISQAALGRFYYYLTTDERTGHLMRQAVETSNKAIGELDPLRLILTENEYPTHARVGPDWFALVGNWMTEWERTGDTEYRDKILAGVKSFSQMPYGFFSGKAGAYGYDPATHKMYQLNKGDLGINHLSVLMGGPEVAYELTGLLDNKEWDKLWLQFTKMYGASEEMVEAEFGRSRGLGDRGAWYARLPAYYANVTGNESYAARAWNDFLDSAGSGNPTSFNMNLYDGNETLKPVLEVPGVSTNNTAQWSLNAIQLLELIGDHFPEDHERVQRGIKEASLD